MKRVPLLVCGAALILLAGGRFLILLVDAALAPKSYRATAQIQFAPDAPLPQPPGELSANLLSSLAKSPKFVEQLASEKHHTASLTESEAIQWLQRSTKIELDPARHSVLLTYYGDVPENTVSVAHVLARAWIEENSPDAKILPAEAAQANHPPVAGFLKSSHVLIPLMATLAGALVFWLGWRMQPTVVRYQDSPAVVAAKY